MKGIDWDRLPHGGDLFGEMHLAETRPGDAPDAPKDSLWPGLALCAVASGAAAWLSDHYGFPIILLGLLIGLSLNFITHDVRTHRGLDFVARNGLRVGIVLLGLQMTFAQVAMLGVWPFAALALVMVLTLGAGILAARLFGQSFHVGLLAGAATAICGASAALAVYGVIGKERLSQAQFALTLVGVSLASAFAMSIYPVLATELALSDKQAGFLIGASIHDVAQAIGGGFAFSDAAGGYATIVKLARVASLAPIVLLISLWLGKGDADAQDAPRGAMALLKRLSLPWFITAFIAVAALNSVIAIPAQVQGQALGVSKALLLLAVTATAMRSRMDLLMQLGWRAVTPVIGATLVSFVLALACALLVIG